MPPHPGAHGAARTGSATPVRPPCLRPHARSPAPWRMLTPRP